MAEVVRMPKLSDTMEEGVVAEWHKNIGEEVQPGEVLAEIETDKATMEFESFQEGVLLHIGVEKGKAAPVDSILAILGKKGEDIQSILDEENSSKTQKAEEIAPKEEVSEPKLEEPKVVVQEQPKETKAVQTVVTTPVKENSGRLKISPLAKRLAEERGINLSFVKGTGEDGRIVKRDIDNYNGSGVGFTGIESYSEEAVSQMRKTIGKRLSESKFSAPHFYLTMEIDMDNLIAARKSVNEVAEVKISFNDFVIKAVSAALRKNPKANSSWLGDRIRYNEHIHIGVAVAVDEGLLVPVVRFADEKTLSQISSEVKQLAKKAKSKKLQPAEWEGNTFTISNLGMFGIDEFTAIINPPDACIMAVGGIKEVPVVKNGQIVPGNIMKVTLSCDHRVVDGAVGSAFLLTFKKYMENPVLLLGERFI